MSDTGWIYDGPLSGRFLGRGEYLAVDGPADGGFWYAAARAADGRRTTRTFTDPEPARDWADSQVRDGRVIPDELAMRRTRGRSR